MTPKYLSVRHPWAHLIVAGVKPIENRPWSTEYRGPVLIHASLRASATPLAEINRRYRLELRKDQFEFGGIIGIVTLASIVRAHPSPFFDGPTTMKDGKEKANYGLVFTRPQRLPFFPMPGRLMLRPTPADALAFYRDALRKRRQAMTRQWKLPPGNDALFSISEITSALINEKTAEVIRAREKAEAMLGYRLELESFEPHPSESGKYVLRFRRA